MSELPSFRDATLRKAFRYIEEMLRVVVTNNRKPVAKILGNDAASIVPVQRSVEAGNSFMLERHRASYFAKAGDLELPRILPAGRSLNANNALKLEGHRASYFAVAGSTASLDELEMKLFLLEGR